MYDNICVSKSHLIDFFHSFIFYCSLCYKFYSLLKILYSNIVSIDHIYDLQFVIMDIINIIVIRGQKIATEVKFFAI